MLRYYKCSHPSTVVVIRLLLRTVLLAAVFHKINAGTIGDENHVCDRLIHGNVTHDLEREPALLFEVTTCSRVKVELYTEESLRYRLEFASSNKQFNVIAAILPTLQSTRRISWISQDCTTTRQLWVSWRDGVISGGPGLSPGKNEVLRLVIEESTEVISKAEIVTIPNDENARVTIFRLSAMPTLYPPADLEQSVHLRDNNYDTCLSLAAADRYTFSEIDKKWIPESQDVCWLPGLAIKVCVPEVKSALFTVNITGRGIFCDETHIEVMGKGTYEPPCGVVGEYMGCKLKQVAARSHNGDLITCLAECICEKTACKWAIVQILDRYDSSTICEINV